MSGSQSFARQELLRCAAYCGENCGSEAFRAGNPIELACPGARPHSCLSRPAPTRSANPLPLPWRLGGSNRGAQPRPPTNANGARISSSICSRRRDSCGTHARTRVALRDRERPTLGAQAASWTSSQPWPRDSSVMRVLSFFLARTSSCRARSRDTPSWRPISARESSSSLSAMRRFSTM
jgi:hypothetical protein